MTRVLLIDSEVMFQECLARFLRDQPDISEVLTANQGEIGWDSIQEHEPDVVILDWELPELHGFDLLYRIRQHEIPCKVLFLSSYISACILHQAITGGASGFLSRRDSLSELLEAISTVPQRKRYYSSLVKTHLVQGENGYQVQSDLLLQSFSELQFVVFRYLAQGLKIQEIADRVELSHSAVESHTYRIMKKLNLSNRPELTRFALREGLATL